MDATATDVIITKLVPLQHSRDAASRVPFTSGDTEFENWYTQKLSGENGITVERGSDLVLEAPHGPRGDVWRSVFNESMRDTVARRHVAGHDWATCSDDVLERAIEVARRIGSATSLTKAVAFAVLDAVCSCTVADMSRRVAIHDDKHVSAFVKPAPGRFVTDRDNGFAKVLREQGVEVISDRFIPVEDFDPHTAHVPWALIEEDHPGVGADYNRIVGRLRVALHEA